MLDTESVALRVTLPAAVTSWLSSVLLARISAAAIWPIVFVTTAPAPAPANEKPAAALRDTATPVPVAETVLSARAVSRTSRPASTSLSLIWALTVPLSEVVAAATERVIATDAPAAKEPPTLTATTSFVSSVSSVAVNVIGPTGASTSESAAIRAWTRFVEAIVATAPAAEAEPDIAPAPPNDTPTPTPSTLTVPVESAVRVTPAAVEAVASEPEIIARAVVPKFTSATDSASVMFRETPPAPPTLTEAATRVASRSALSVALRLTESASTSAPPVMLASTTLVIVLRAMTALPDTLIDSAPAPPADSAAATPTALILMRSTNPAS